MHECNKMSGPKISDEEGKRNTSTAPEACYGRGAPLFSCGSSLGELCTPPQKKIWRKKKVLPDEQSQVFSIQRKMLQRQDRNCDDFALRSPVIHKQFQPKTCYLYRITPPMAYRVDNGGSIAVVPDSGGSIAVVTPGGSATWWVSSFFRSHSCTPLFVKVVIIQLHVAPEVCACSSR